MIVHLLYIIVYINTVYSYTYTVYCKIATVVKKIRQFHAASHPNGLIDPNINGGEIANRLTLIG